MREKMWIVISDIDETLKATSTESLCQYIRHLFNLWPISGMPDVFFLISKVLKPKFFYLSSGPEFLRPHYWRFIHSYYPAGCILLAPCKFTPMPWVNTRHAILNHKVERISQILLQEPDTNVICIGDDSCADLDVYMWAYRQYPGRVKGIFIKDTGIGERRLRTANRIKQVDNHVIRIFSNAQELRVGICEATLTA